MLPPEPAAFSVWQPPQPFAANACFPAASAAAAGAPAGVAVVVVDVEAGAGAGAGTGVTTAAFPATLATYAATSFASLPVTRFFGMPGDPVEVSVMA